MHPISTLFPPPSAWLQRPANRRAYESSADTMKHDVYRTNDNWELTILNQELIKAFSCVQIHNGTEIWTRNLAGLQIGLPGLTSELKRMETKARKGITHIKQRSKSACVHCLAVALCNSRACSNLLPTCCGATAFLQLLDGLGRMQLCLSCNGGNFNVAHHEKYEAMLKDQTSWAQVQRC